MLSSKPWMLVLPATAITAVGTLVAANPAQAASLSAITFSGSFAEQQTDFVDSSTLQQFDPALGTLEQVLVEMEGTINGSLTLENTGSQSATVLSAGVEGQFTLSGGGTDLVQIFPLIGVENVTLDPGETLVFEDLTQTTDGAETYGTAEDPPFSAFIGTDFLTVSFEALGFSSFSGSSNVSFDPVTTGTANYSVTYLYEARAIPEPATLLGTAVAGSLGWLTLRKRKQQHES